MPPPDVQWLWCNLDDERAYLLDAAASPHGWLAVGPEDNSWELIVYQAAFGMRARLEWGSLELETDAHESWTAGKQTCEVLLKHAIAISEELNRLAHARLLEGLKGDR